MKSEGELRLLFDNQLKEKLSELESVRKSVLQRYIICVFLFIGLGAVNYFLINQHPNEAVIIVSILVSVGFFVYYVYQTSVRQKKYRQSFKSNVVAGLVEQINPEWQYQSDSCIGERRYYHSGLFPQHNDRYLGDDFVSGKIEKTDFEFSELHTQYKQVTYGAKGQRHEQWITIFKGLFMHADFNKEFAGTTFVLPDTAERLFGSFGQSLQKLSSRGELVKLENVDFEKRFVVYSSDQVESRYILTPAMMEAMLNFSNRFDNSIYLSFVGSRVYCAMSFTSNLFEPNIFRSGVNFNDIKEMYNLFGIIETLIKELNLNTRIWTKD
jgi:Protein of unknown function (DUF3137)